MPVNDCVVFVSGIIFKKGIIKVQMCGIGNLRTTHCALTLLMHTHLC